MYTVNTKINNQLSIWLITMFWFVSIMIVVGGLTRLTDSGLSITTWQFFSGIMPPMNDLEWIKYFNLYKKIPEYQLQNYEMTMLEFKVIFWWEWGHRFLGRLIGLGFIIPLIYFSFKVNFKNLLNYYFIFSLICLQGFIGWYMVSSGLVDRIDVSHYRLSVHLLLAFIILSLIFWNYLKLKNLESNNIKLSSSLIVVFVALIFCQIVIGAFVSGMDAGKIYNSWPLMGSTYFPDDSYFKNLLSMNAFNDPSLVQFMHLNLAYLILISYLIVLYRTYHKKIKEFYLSINLI